MERLGYLSDQNLIIMERKELKRYDRQILLTEVGLAGQQKFNQSSVLVIGAGGLGCPVLQYLVAAGIGRIGVVDDDIVEESNLHRQILFNDLDIGKPKAEVAAAKLRLLNPLVTLTDHVVRLIPENSEELIKGYDLVIDGSDNFKTRYLVNDTCLKLNKPLVFGSIFKFEGQISVFNYKGGPNYRTFFPESPAEGTSPNCDEIGVIGMLPGIVGSYMANEAVKIIGNFGEVLSGRLLMINVLTNVFEVFSLVHLEPYLKELDPENKMSLQVMRDIESKGEQVCLIDVRESYEYEEENIGGINISLYDLPSKIDELPKDKKILLYCTNGVRSKTAFNFLKGKFKAGIFILQ